ncbi:unnamed protein product [Mytilus edulis]|uniref:Uncharacterized protein n=1 Tax=Mytilus edulis TaxID=6550 RepID=A0A8S3U877_MYTED|nr:unnamed protein product [Mytilus edulis]
MLGKLVATVLKTKSRTKYINNKPFTYFDTLVEKNHSSNTKKLQIPPHCQVKTENMALTIKCAREYYLNGVRLQCTATFAPNSTSIKILGHKVDERICSKACEKINSWNFKHDFCGICARLVRSTVKRKMEQELPLTNEQIIDKLLSTGAPENFKILLESQLQNCKSNFDIHQRRWHSKILSLCLTLYCKSPNAYDNLRQSGMLCLPAKSTLICYKNCVKQKPGINHDNLTWMSKEAVRQQVSIFGHIGGLLLNEMSIQDDIEITRKGDAWEIVGGIDMGQTNNAISTITNRKKEVKLATHC